MLTVFLLVEDDILGIPRIRRNVFNLSVRYASSSPGRRASLLVMIPLEKAWLRFPLCIVFFTLSLVGVGARFDILIVGTVRPYLLCKLTVLKIGRALAVEHSETGMRTERSIGRITERDPSVVGEPLPRLFSPITVEKRFDCVSVLQNTLACSNISTLRSG